MTKSNIRIRCCPCYFDYCINALNEQENFKYRIRTLSGLWLRKDIPTINYYFILREDILYHTCFFCLEYFLTMSVFGQKSFVQKILNRNCVVKRNSDVNFFSNIS